MPRGSLPGYAWDAIEGLYRRADGVYVTRAEVVAGLRVIARRSENLLGDLAVAVAQGELTSTDGALAGAQFLKDLYNANSALARGGWANMDFTAWGRNGQILRGEYAHWRKFMADIATGELSEAQIRQRAALYVGKAYARFWLEDRLMKLADATMQYETWVSQEDPVVCPDCVALAALGTVPLGTLPTVPGAGFSQCRGACRCAILYS